MIKKITTLLILLSFLSIRAEVTVTTIDFLKTVGVDVNAAGPLLVQMDIPRNRIIVANTLSSSLSIIDGPTHAVTNIPISGRILQHLKAAAMTINKRTGDIYLIGMNCFHIISPETKTAHTINTDVQFEAIAVDEITGNVFIVGRESKQLGFYDAKKQRLKMRPWLNHAEALINLNATPPPPIRKVIADSELHKIIAIDGYTSTLYLINPRNGKIEKSRTIPLNQGGRWHFAGYNQQTHHLYLVIETAKRKVIQAAKIAITDKNDIVVPLPKYTEAVGINYNPLRDEVYIPYDNHPTVHAVTFTKGGKVEALKVPAYGNDASALDIKNDILYVASWAHGEIEVIDLKKRILQKRIRNLGILPHTFNIAFNPHNNLLYIPRGATAVNGTFGAAIYVVDPLREYTEKIYTGWAPIDLVEVKSRHSFLIFNSEDQFAEVHADGYYQAYRLPYDYPLQAITSPRGNIYLSYGPHQSYWPDVYIWSAKNGILTIRATDLSFYDRRIPRQAHKMVLDKKGVLYFTQNNWGREEQFLGRITDEVRDINIGRRLRLQDKVEREITQRILQYDSTQNRLYLVRVGEKNNDPGILQIINLDSQKVEQRLSVGLTPTDLLFDSTNIYIANFESHSVTIVDKKNYRQREIKTGSAPLKLCRCGNTVYVLNHLGKSLQEVKEKGRTFPLPQNWLPDNVIPWQKKLVITAHNNNALYIAQFDPQIGAYTLLHQYNYPFGDTRFNTHNVSFYITGQFGDAIFSITSAKVDSSGRLWITDFLAGKLFILQK